jgi:hypothetical protein
VPDQRSRKLVRSYRIVFRRRWRIFKVQNWRIPLPNGLELRALGYWAACLVAIALLARTPLLGLPISALPPSIRLLAAPVAAAWALSRWEVDGRSPHRALLGLIGHRLRPRNLAGLRRCPREGADLITLEQLTVAPDTAAPDYPRGRIAGPATVLLRYPATVQPQRKDWRLRQAPAAPLHRGRTLHIPAGHAVSFE